MPSPPCPVSRIQRSLRKSRERSADRARRSVPGWEATLMAREHTGGLTPVPFAASGEQGPGDQADDHQHGDRADDDFDAETGWILPTPSRVRLPRIASTAPRG